MNSFSITKILCISLFSFAIVACKKGGDSGSTTNQQPSQRSKLLCQKPWIEIKALQSYNNISWTDAYSGLQDCVKDNQTAYVLDGSFNYNEGATKCYSTGQQIIQEGTWSFTEADENVIRTKDQLGQFSDYLILKLDNDTLHVNGSYQGASIVFTDVTYVHP